MKRVAIPLWILVLLAIGPSVLPQDDPGYKVIIHGENPTVELEQSKVAKIFLKRIRRWDDDEPVTAVDQNKDSPARIAFTKGVHGKDVGAILKYWQRMIFSGRDVNPEELAGDVQVLKFVRTHRGAIGYVSGTTDLGEGVKELKVTPKG
jgi:ABC-type phosphate transport system substrate-binding protein